MNFKSNISIAILLASMNLLSVQSVCADDAVSSGVDSVVLSSYQLQQGDTVTISVWGEETLMMKDLRVLPDGTISFPLVGSVVVRDTTPNQVSALLAEKLKQFLPEPQVTVVVTSTEGNKAYIVGKVSKPGPIPLVNPTTVLNALSMAGVLDRFADKSSIKIIRMTDNGQVAIPVHYDSLIRGSNLESNILLKTGDTIVVT